MGNEGCMAIPQIPGESVALERAILTYPFSPQSGPQLFFTIQYFCPSSVP